MSTLIILVIFLSGEPLTEVNGFLYQTEGGETVLSEEANLPTCCQGTKKKRATQIFIQNQSLQPSPGEVVTLKGRMERRGERVVLLDAELVKRKRTSFLWWFVGGVVLLGMGFVYTKRRLSKTNS